jgi:hypothetical protein
MKLRLALLALAGMMAACATTTTGGAGMAASGCDRACLADNLDVYLDAVLAHDPNQAPLFEGFRQTENAVVTPLGEGVWRELTGLRSLDRRYYDAVSGAAVFMGTAVHKGEPSIVSVRIRVERGEITEAEWHLAHASDAGIEGAPGETLFDVDEIERNPPPQRSVPAGERASRELLAAVANSYFDGITNASRRIALAHPGCARFENGMNVTGRPLAEDRQWDGLNGMSDCLSGQGAFNVENVAARRTPVIDEEAQIVIASAVFIREEDHPKWRNAFSDVMVMDGGRLSRLYATMFYVPPSRAVPNWPPYEGNFAR